MSNNIFNKETLTNVKCTVDRSGFVGDSSNLILDNLEAVTFKYELMYNATIQRTVAAILPPLTDATINLLAIELWDECGGEGRRVMVESDGEEDSRGRRLDTVAIARNRHKVSPDDGEYFHFITELCTYKLIRIPLNNLIIICPCFMYVIHSIVLLKNKIVDR
mmetsp:Transcript_27653/g.41124  ORF Transcript_27653/g.41124 Transcript_27653/m.41124 type:complete len:163 (-) Transcript_27653:116-604(-)